MPRPPNEPRRSERGGSIRGYQNRVKLALASVRLFPKIASEPQRRRYCDQHRKGFLLTDGTRRECAEAFRPLYEAALAPPSRSLACFKERHFKKGETVVRESAGGAAFFIIDTGEVEVTT